MADENILNIIARVQLGDLKAGMEQAANTVKASTEQMAADFAKVQTGSVGLAAQLRAQGLSSEEAGSALKNLGYTSKEVAAAITAVEVATGEATVATDTNTAATDANVAAKERQVSSYVAAQGALRVLEGSTMGATRAAGAFLATTLGLGPVLEAAFPIIGIAAFAEILFSTGQKLYNFYQDVVHLRGEIAALAVASAKTAKEAAEANWQYIQSEAELKRALHDRAGAEQFLRENAGAKPESLSLGMSDAQMQKLPKAMQEFAESLKNVNTAAQAATVFKQLDEQVTETQEKIKKLQAIIANPPTVSYVTRGQVISHKEDVSAFQNELDAANEYYHALSNLRQKSASEEATERNRELREGIEPKKKEKKTLKDYDPTVTLAQIDADKQVADARLKLQEETIRAAFEAKKISLDKELALELQTEQEKYTADVAAVNRKIAFEQSKPVGNQEERDKQKDELIKLNAELEVLEAEHQSKMNSIRSEGAKKQTEALKQEMDEQVRLGEEAAKAQLAKDKSLDDDKLKNHRITLQQWGAAETAALDKWYDEQKSVIQNWLSAMKAAHQENTQDYQRMIDKLNQLDQQRAAKQREIDKKTEQEFKDAGNVMATSFATAFQKMTTTNQAFGKTMVQFWNQLVLGFDKMLAQLLANWIKNISMRVLQETLGHSQILASLIAHITGTTAIQAAGNATKLAQTVATNTAIVTSEAGVAGAEAYAAMVGIPYVGPVIAPAAMATAIATTLSNLGLASAAGGYDLPHVGAEGMLAKLHSREMVLPQRLADNVRNMTSNSTSRGGDFHHHGDINIHPPAGSEMSEESIIAAVRSGMRRGMLPSGI